MRKGSRTQQEIVEEVLTIRSYLPPSCRDRYQNTSMMNQSKSSRMVSNRSNGPAAPTTHYENVLSGESWDQLQLRSAWHGVGGVPEARRRHAGQVDNDAAKN